MPNVSREELINVLSETFKEKSLGSKKRIKDKIKKGLQEYDVLSGDVEDYIQDTETSLKDVDIRIICLLMDESFKTLGVSSLNPENYFTETEIQESKQYTASMERASKVDFPITIPNATVVGNSAFMVTLDIQTIRDLLNSQLLKYNFDVQREASYVKRHDTVTPVATLNMSNVKEISEHLVNGTLVPTVLVFNAATRTSENGEELIFDSKRAEITITKGTRLDIVDGYHRCKAVVNALMHNDNIKFNFAVLLTNYSTKKAQQYQAQLAKATPISKTRVQELEAKRYSDLVVQQLREESDLKGRISQTNRIHRMNDELVAYNVLADAIDEQFKMDTKIDAMDTADYLTEFFDYLIGSFPNEFLNNIAETRKNSIINDNNMFVGYVILARKMKNDEIKINKIRNIINNIDFSRDNKLWENLSILEKGKITDKTRVNIKRYFDELNLKDYLGESVTSG